MNNIKQNKFIYLPLVLAIFTIICSLGIGTVQIITKPVIDAANQARLDEQAKEYKNIFSLYAEANNLGYGEIVQGDGDPIIQKLPLTNGNKTGVAIMGETKINASGAGNVKAMVGILDGKLIGFKVLESAESKGDNLVAISNDIYATIYGKTEAEITGANIIATGVTRNSDALKVIISAAFGAV